MKKFIAIAAFLFCINDSYSQRILTPTNEGSMVHFVIKNFGIKTGGDLSGLKGIIKFDPKNLSVWAFDITVDASTIDTDNSSRDGHLKKAEYFDVARYPTIHLLSTKISATDKPGIYLLNANLTIKGVTKPLKFTFKVNSSKDGYMFAGEFPMNRRDFNIGGSSVSMADNLKVMLSVFAK